MDVLKIGQITPLTEDAMRPISTWSARGLLALVAIVAGATWAIIDLVEQRALAPYEVKKKLTVSIAHAGTVVVVFSNAQPHNEIIFEIKTDWVPRFEQDPMSYVGQTIQTPYFDYLAAQRHRLRSKIRLIAILTFVACAFALGFRRMFN